MKINANAALTIEQRKEVKRLFEEKNLSIAILEKNGVSSLSFRAWPGIQSFNLQELDKCNNATKLMIISIYQDAPLFFSLLCDLLHKICENSFQICQQKPIIKFKIENGFGIIISKHLIQLYKIP